MAAIVNNRDEEEYAFFTLDWADEKLVRDQLPDDEPCTHLKGPR